jgi:hypothetical protein
MAAVPKRTAAISKHTAAIAKRNAAIPRRIADIAKRDAVMDKRFAVIQKDVATFRKGTDRRPEPDPVGFRSTEISRNLFRPTPFSVRTGFISKRIPKTTNHKEVR